MDIIDIIKKNKLSYYKIDTLAKKLQPYMDEANVDIKNAIVELLKSGDLFLDENGKIFISKDKGYLKAKISINKKGYGFASVDGFNDFFIPAFAINGAFDGDDCLIEITNMKSNTEAEAKVVRILSRNTKRIVGTYLTTTSKNIVFPDDERLPQIRIYKGESLTAQNNDKVWVELDMDSLEKGINRGRIIEVLGKANTPRAEQIAIIRSFNLEDRFPDSVLAEAKAINQKVDIKKYKDREDYTEHKVITIDGEDARDFDDALSVIKTEQGYTLFIHIADVTNYVTENSPIDKEAYHRGTSVYFSNMVIPMLPKELSNGVCSLSEGENRLTLTVEISLDNNCKVLASQIKKGIIKSAHRMTYTEIKNIIDGDTMLIEKYQDVYQDILAYQEISQKLKAIRRKRGEIELAMPEPFILENAEGQIVSIEKRIQDESHEIIESLMVLANECVAQKYFEIGLPFVYRVHEKPDDEKLIKISEVLRNMGVANDLEDEGKNPIAYQKVVDKIKGMPAEQTLMKLILRSLMKARYCSKCLGHFGLASEFYCHFTSPIRRYPDLQIHRIIKRYLGGESVEDIKARYCDIVERTSEQSSTTERNADEAEREMDDYKKSVYMLNFLGEQFTGTISGVQEFGIFVELDNGIEGMIKTCDLPLDNYSFEDNCMMLLGESHKYVIGDKLDVVVAASNTKLHQIDFVLANQKEQLGGYVVNKENRTTKANGKPKKIVGRNKHTGDNFKSRKRKSTRRK